MALVEGIYVSTNGPDAAYTDLVLSIPDYAHQVTWNEFDTYHTGDIVFYLDEFDQYAHYLARATGNSHTPDYSSVTTYWGRITTVRDGTDVAVDATLAAHSAGTVVSSISNLYSGFADLDVRAAQPGEGTAVEPAKVFNVSGPDFYGVERGYTVLSKGRTGGGFGTQSAAAMAVNAASQNYTAPQTWGDEPPVWYESGTVVLHEPDGLGYPLAYQALERNPFNPEVLAPYWKLFTSQYNFTATQIGSDVTIEVPV